VDNGVGRRKTWASEALETAAAARLTWRRRRTTGYVPADHALIQRHVAAHYRENSMAMIPAPLEGKIAVVTGAGSGMGRAIAQRFAREGAQVAIWDINGEGADETARTITEAGNEAIAITADCSDKDQIKAAADQTRASFGPISILVNNAGIAPFVKFADTDEDMFDKVIRINLKGPWLCLQEILPDMLAAGWGRVINITSSSTQNGTFKQSAYVASKGGLLGLTKGLALELGKKGVTFNVVPPGSVDTPMLRSSGLDVEEYGKTLPVGRVGTGEDIAAACSYLASPDAGYTTGQKISIHGGR
jgi:2-hydroxycyclohexanecarboxyl-CoA dehydrogenase